MKRYEKLERVSNKELNVLNSMLNKPIDILSATWLKKGLSFTDEQIKTLYDEKITHDETLMKDLKQMVDVFLSFNENNAIAVYGDYDMDGISSTGTMLRSFQYLRNRTLKYLESCELNELLKSCDNPLVSFDDLKTIYADLEKAKMVFKKVEKKYERYQKNGSAMLSTYPADESEAKKVMTKDEVYPYLTFYSKKDKDFITKYPFNYKFLTYYLPDRVKDGYGITVKAVEMLYKNGVNTIITVDNGIAAVEAVNRAKELGMKIYITDHHECPKTPAQGDLTVNPQQPDCKYPFKGICGAQVAYKICKRMLEEAGVSKDEYIYKRIHQYATLGTIGDVMPLIDENRYFVKEGIELMKKEPCKLIKYLSIYTNLPLSDLTSKEIAFSWVPTFNAVGRLSNAEKALEALLTDDDEQLKCKVSTLIYINEKRKVIKKELIKKGKDLLDNSKKSVMLKYGKTYEGMMGIIAGNFAEETQKPTGAFSLAEDGLTALGTPKYILKGSMRAPNGFDVFATLQAMEEKGFPFIKYGGHKGAAGLSIPRNQWNLFVDMFNENLVQSAEVDSIKYMEATIGEVSELSKNIQYYGTYGQGIPHPNIQLNINSNIVGYIESGHIKLGSVFLYNRLPEVQNDLELQRVSSAVNKVYYTPKDSTKMFSLICEVSSGQFRISGIDYFLVDKATVSENTIADESILDTDLEEVISVEG